MTVPPPRSEAALGELSFAHLQAVVAVDSQSDEASPTIPSTEGQRRLGETLASFYAALGATVERDAQANVLAWFPGRGAKAGAAPVAFMVHIDTARGTQAVPSLHRVPGWDGSRVRFPKNPGIQVDLATYPAAAHFRGHDLVHGPGDCPFGLDDKLGLAHCMTLATLLPEAAVDHPPVVFVGRPDEEIGRDAAVVGLAKLLAERGVRYAYTVDGILPFEVNVENFYAAVAHVRFASSPPRPMAASSSWVAHVGGVNTHGATAMAEGHRAAPRLVAEWRAALPEADVCVDRFQSDALRDCDAVVHLRVAPGAEVRVREALEAVMAEHLPRGASARLEPAPPVEGDGAVEEALAWLSAFYSSNPGFTLPAEASEGRDGYSHPYRIRAVEGGVQLDVRIRDFAAAGREARVGHVRALAGARGFAAEHQYENMGPRMAAYPEVVAWARAAAEDVGAPVSVTPIRGGTGVDPFLDVGIPVGNLGTGYFAPESEKELTSVQMMGRHAAWLFALLQRLG